MNVSVLALSAFLMTTFVCGKYMGGGGWLWDKRHTHIMPHLWIMEGVRQGIHSPSCRSVATDKGDVLRPLLIRHSGKGLQILYLLSPHNSSGLGATHSHLDTHKTGVHIHTQTEQAQTAWYTDRPTQIQTRKFIHISLLLNHKHTHRRTLCDTSAHWV